MIQTHRTLTRASPELPAKNSRKKSHRCLRERSMLIRSNRMKFATVLDRDEDGMWIAECPSIPGCVSQGKTREEALANIKEAIALCLEVRAERGMPLTIETQQVEVSV